MTRRQYRLVLVTATLVVVAFFYRQRAHTYVAELRQCRVEAAETMRIAAACTRAQLAAQEAQVEAELVDTGRRLERLQQHRQLMEALVDGGL